MGTSTNAVLAYGYDLGAEESFLVREAQESETNPYGYLKTDWYDAEHEDLGDGEDEDEEGSLIEALTKRLYEAIPDAPDVQYAFEHEDPVKDHFGVWFESYCSVDYPMWILTTSQTTVYRGSTELIDPVAMSAQSQTEGWDGKLAAALTVLGITPLQEKPGWLLASDWG